MQTVGAVIVQNGRVLFGKRADWKKVAPGYWCPISGRIEAGESEEQALVRECMEEVGVVVRPIRRLGSLDTLDKHAVIHFWHVEVVAGEVHRVDDENSEIAWFTLDELESLSPVFIEDIEIVRLAFE